MKNKKMSLKNLKFNKEKISNLNTKQIIGGTGYTYSCNTCNPIYCDHGDMYLRTKLLKDEDGNVSGCIPRSYILAECGEPSNTNPSDTV